jgi:hypothetical protein
MCVNEEENGLRLFSGDRKAQKFSAKLSIPILTSSGPISTSQEISAYLFHSKVVLYHSENFHSDSDEGVQNSTVF